MAEIEIGESIGWQDAFRLAIQEAQKGRGYVSPNPLVGCTIVSRGGKLVSVGYHARYGDRHAEVDALQKIQSVKDLEGATVYVTLEPCAHEGKTGSCAKALAKLPIARVIYGIVDPNPLVAGKGAQILRDAGIEALSFSEFLGARKAAESPVLQELENLPEIFLKNFESKEVFVAIKVATSTDGKMALKSGGQVWITGEKAREHVQWLRLGYDAVMIGRGTYEIDNPSLNIRIPGRDVPNNKVVIVDPRGKSLATLAQSNLAKVRPAKDILVVVADSFVGSNPTGAQVIKLTPNADGQISAEKILQALWDRGIRSVFIEGGAGTFATFLAEKKVHKLYHFISPKVIGDDGIPWLKSGLAIPKFTRSEMKKLGEDILEFGPLTKG